MLINAKLIKHYVRNFAQTERKSTQKVQKGANPKTYVGNDDLCHACRFALVQIQDRVELKFATTLPKSGLKGCQVRRYLVVH